MRIKEISETLSEGHLLDVKKRQENIHYVMSNVFARLFSFDKCLFVKRKDAYQMKIVRNKYFFTVLHNKPNE